MANPQHIKWLKEGRDAWNVRRERDDFIPDFSDLGTHLADVLWDFPASLAGFNLQKANFSGTRDHFLWLNTTFSESDLKNADFRNSQLIKVDFEYADLSEADLSRARCDSANFIHTKMVGANLSNTDFGGALLFGADLKNAKLLKTILYTAKLTGADVRDTDLSRTKNLLKNHYRQMRGNSGTKLPARLPFPDEWRDDYAAPDEHAAENALDTPAVRSAPVDFDIVDTGVEAHLPADHSAAKNSYSRDGQNRAAALIDNARTIAGAVSNKLGEDTRTDLLAYATHLEVEDPANPHRLSFIAKGIAADLGDDLVAAGYSNRLKTQLQDFLNQHQQFLEEVIPAAAEAIATRDSIKPVRDFTSEDATEIIDTMDQAIERAEAATESYAAMIQGLRDHDAELQAMKLKAFSRDEIDRFDKLLERVTVENATIVSRLYFRAKETIEKVRENGVTTARKHAGDLAIAGTLTGKSAQEMAQVIVNYLQPLMEKLAQILTILPPL